MRMPCRIPWRPTSPWPIRTGSWRWPAYIGNSSMVCVLLLEVYGPEGLLYATARVPSVERQFAADNVRSMWVREDKKAPFPEADISTPIPELTWEK